MTKPLPILALAAALSGCFLTYDPEAVEPAPGGGASCEGPGSLCEPQSCTGSTLSYASFCTNGTCPAQTTASCDPYVCGGTGCKTSCGGDVDCTDGNFCLVSSCTAKRTAGELCASANQCASGFCSPDGRCCDSACTGSCETCNGVNTVGGAPAGTCATLQFGSRPEPGHTDCTGSATGACAGACDGVTAAICAYPGAVACGTCRSCDGAGLCLQVPAGQDPHGSCSRSSCQLELCNASGGCDTAPGGLYCDSSGCTEGAPDAFGRPTSASATVATCSGAIQSCPAPSASLSCNLHTCEADGSCNLICLDNSDCTSGTVCVSGRCQVCASSVDCHPGSPQCTSGPSGAVCDCPGDPSCADAICNSPGDCMAAGFGSVCAQYWDYCQCTVGDNACNGRAPRCPGSPGSCSCGPVAGTLCPVGQLCSDATLAGTCKIAPGFPCTANPADCASGTCGAGGMCSRLPATRPCARPDDCASSVCDTTWRCF